MPDEERELADCVGAVYEASTNGGDWLDVGQRICRLVGAQSATLRFQAGSQATRNLLMTPSEGDAAYVTYFHNINPFIADAHRDFAAHRGRGVGRVRLGSDLMPDDAFVRSEYYNDFARQHGRRHMMGGLIGITEATPLALFRGDASAPFGENEIRLLRALLPHVQRALELRSRIAGDEKALGLSRALLEGLPFGAVVVDPGLRIDFMNRSADRVLSDRDSGLHAMRSGPNVGNGIYLAASTRSEITVLRCLVASACCGGAGGGMRVESDDGAMIALLVSPLPGHLAHEFGAAAGTPTDARALIVMRAIARKAAPPAALLSDLFGFSRAEAEVAVALCGGSSAEEVASQRGVSLVTVRSQIRSVLSKSQTANLRDFERVMATVASLTP